MLTDPSEQEVTPPEADLPSAGSPSLVVTLARGLLEGMREQHTDIVTGKLSVSLARRHRTEGAITVLEAILGLPASLADWPADQQPAA